MRLRADFFFRDNKNWSIFRNTNHKREKKMFQINKIRCEKIYNWHHRNIKENKSLPKIIINH